MEKETSSTGFQCNLCPKSFRYKYILTLHSYYSHTIESPYQCDKCGWKFRNEDYRNRHKKKCKGRISKQMEGVSNSVDNGTINPEIKKDHQTSANEKNTFDTQISNEFFDCDETRKIEIKKENIEEIKLEVDDMNTTEDNSSEIDPLTIDELTLQKEAFLLQQLSRHKPKHKKKKKSISKLKL